MNINNCRSCGSPLLEEILNLGNQHLSDFREDASATHRYPLIALICHECMLVQLSQNTPQELMYHENYGFKSGVSDSIKADLKEAVEKCLEIVPAPVGWLDIASNDGTLLSFVPETIERVGVDPIEKLCDEADAHADKIVRGFFSDELMQREYNVEFDVVTSVSCFYDMPDPNKFVIDVTKRMTPNAVWCIQQNYLLPTLQLGAVDNFCHEHLEYYTLLSLEPLLKRHGLEVFKVSTSDVNGGSIRTFVGRKGAYRVDASVITQRNEERAWKLHELSTYHDFKTKVFKTLRELKLMVSDINRAGGKVYILAASTRGSTIWQAAGLTKRDCPKAVERNPAKVGRYFNALGIPIISEEQARAEKPTHMLVGIWFFADEVMKREQQYMLDGGTLIFPLPVVYTRAKRDVTGEDILKDNAAMSRMPKDA